MSNRTPVVVVRHLRESFKSTGTARIAELGLKHCTMVEFSDDATVADRELQAMTEGAWLLFPGEGGSVPPTPPRSLVVLDGTWRQTRKMRKKLPSLQALPLFSLPEKNDAPLRLREAPAAESRSTLEAIADALELIDGPDVGQPLHALHAMMVERVLRARGVWDFKLKARAAERTPT